MSTEEEKRARRKRWGVEEKAEVHLVALMLCDFCIEGRGGECHVPGCALSLNRAPDLSIRDKIVAKLNIEYVGLEEADRA